MELLASNSYGIYQPHYLSLRKYGCSPCEIAIFGKIASLIKSYGKAFIVNSKFAEELGYNTQVISRCVGKLIRKGFVRKTEKKHFGHFFYVEICVNPNDLPIDQKVKLQPEPTLSSEIIDQPILATKPPKQPQEIKEEIKITTKVFSENKKIAVKQKLKLLGMDKIFIQKLMNKNICLEKIEEQIQHLEFLKSQGKEIAKPGPWLYSAITTNYKLPAQINENESTDKKIQARIWLQRALYEKKIENYEQAKNLVQKSLAIAELNEAKELLHELETIFTNQSKLAQIKAKIPKEILEQMLQEELSKTLNNLKRFGQMHVTQLHMLIAQNAVDERLLS